MALTIEQIQANITNKADAREIINQIADYIQANPGGGGSSLVYTATLTLPEVVSSTSGVLVVGKTYQITTLEAGDDFTNVGYEGPLPFVATGTTPTDGGEITGYYIFEGSGPGDGTINNISIEFVNAAFEHVSMSDLVGSQGKVPVQFFVYP